MSGRRSDRGLAVLRSPRWIAGHIVALVAVVGFVALGFWQLARLDQRRSTNDRIETRFTGDPILLTDALREYGADPSALEYRKIEVTGTYVSDEEVLLLARSLNGVSGHHVLTPLIDDTGTSIIVDRGWVPIDAAGPPVPDALPPEGRVTVVGIARRSVQRGPLGKADSTDAFDRIARVDLERLAPQTSGRLAPIYIELAVQTPAQESRYPEPVPPPDLSEGPHLSYAVQWFVFAAVVVVGYPTLLYRTAAGKTRPVPTRPSASEHTGTSAR